ncbi:MAG: SHOCT domain-containing protein [Chloroflexota bacterium]
MFLIALFVNWLIPSGNDGFFGAIGSFISMLLWWVTVIALVIAAVGFGWSAARWKSQEYVLTNQRVIHVSGVITKQSSDSVLESLSDARIEIPFLGRMMGWGNLVLMTANESGNEKMLALPDPIGFKKAVLEAKTMRTVAINTASYSASNAAYAAAAPTPAPAPVAPVAAPTAASTTSEDVTKTLTALAGLRDSGAITPEEFEAKKKELLDRI